MKYIKNKTVVILTSLIAIFAMYFTFSVEEVNANKVYDFSMYFRSSEVATAFGKAMAPALSGDDDEAEELGDDWLGEGITAGNAGGLLGYTRELSESEGGVGNWLANRLSGNAMTYGYDQLIRIGGSDDVSNNALLAYGGYGGFLESTNLATTRDFTFTDTLTGLVFSGIFILSQAVPFFFNLVLKLMVLMNPFQLFTGAIGGLAGFADSLPIMGTLVEFVSDIYLSIQDISLYVILPVTIGITAMSIFFRNSEGAGKKVFRLFFRFFMVFAGLPLIGATYTGVITNLADNMSLGSPFANYVIASQFVDTEGWIKTTRLDPPKENPLKFKYYKGEFTYPSAVSRETVLEINSTRTFGKVALGGLRGMNATDSIDAVEDSSDPSMDGASVRQQGSIAQDLLDRYRRKDRISASDYEGYVKSELGKGGEADAQIEQMFTPDAVEFEKNKDDAYSNLFVHGPTPEAFDDKLSWGIYNMGGLTVKNTDGELTFDSIGTSYSKSAALPVLMRASGEDWTQAAGLSPLAMYNFLNTRFSTTGMAVYSPETSSSVFTSNDYMSVSRVNSGMYGGISMAESLVLLMSSAIIGGVYAWALLGIALASIPRIMTSAFGTATGSMAMITKLLVSTIVLIAEIIGTILIFVVFDTLLLNFLRSMTAFVETITEMPGLSGFLAGALLPTLKELLVIILGIAVTRFALKYRVRFSKMVEEISVDMITKLMGGLDNSLNQGEMFHDPSAVRDAAGGAQLHGKDGMLGSEGSASYANEVAGGEHAEEKQGLGLKDSVAEEYGQERSKARIQGEDYTAPDRKDFIKNVADRQRARTVAGAKDNLAKKLGMGGVILAAANVADLDGGARQRMFEEEEAERQQLSDQYRGFGRSAGGDDSEKAGIKEGVGPELAVEGGPIDSKGVDAYNDDIEGIDNQAPDDIISNHATMDDEELAILDDDGEISGDQSEYGTIDEAVNETRSDSPTYDMEDQNADDMMIEAFGDEADSVSLDDPKDHPGNLTPLTEEHDQYVDDLGQAADAQIESAKRHSESIANEEAEAERLLNQAEQLEASALSDPNNVDSELMSEAKELRNKSQEHSMKADEHRKQGRQSLRKADKLRAKQKDANKTRVDSYKNHGKHQSNPVNSAQKLVQAEAKVGQLSEKLDDLKSTGASASEISNAEQELEKTQKAVQSIKRNAQSAMPTYKTDSKMAHSKEELQNVAENEGWSGEKLATAIAHVPDEQQVEQGQMEAARVIGQMANQVGTTPQATMRKQASYMNREMSQLAGKIDQQLPAKTAQAQMEMEQVRGELQENMSELRSLTPGATKKERDTAQAKVNSSRAALSTAQSEFKNISAMNRANTTARVQLRTMQNANTANQEHLAGQSRSMGKLRPTARQMNNSDQKYNRVYSTAKERFQPNNSALAISNGNSPSRLIKESSVLESEGVQSPEAFRSRIEASYAGIDETYQEIERLQTRIKNSRRSTNTFKRGQMQSQLRQLNEKLNMQKQTGRAQRRKLIENASGLYKNSEFKISSTDNMRITDGRAINAPIPDVINTVEHLGRLSAKLENSVPTKNAELPEELRNKRNLMKQEYDAVRTQLVNAGISEKMLRTKHSISEVVNGLNQEWIKATGYDPGDKRN